MTLINLWLESPNAGVSPKAMLNAASRLLRGSPMSSPAQLKQAAVSSNTR